MGIAGGLDDLKAHYPDHIVKCTTIEAVTKGSRTAQQQGKTHALLIDVHAETAGSSCADKICDWKSFISQRTAVMSSGVQPATPTIIVRLCERNSTASGIPMGGQAPKGVMIGSDEQQMLRLHDMSASERSAVIREDAMLHSHLVTQHMAEEGVMVEAIIEARKEEGDMLCIVMSLFLPTQQCDYAQPYALSCVRYLAGLHGWPQELFAQMFVRDYDVPWLSLHTGLSEVVQVGLGGLSPVGMHIAQANIIPLGPLEKDFSAFVGACAWAALNTDYAEVLKARVGRTRVWNGNKSSAVAVAQHLQENGVRDVTTFVQVLNVTGHEASAIKVAVLGLYSSAYMPAPDISTKVVDCACGKAGCTQQRWETTYQMQGRHKLTQVDATAMSEYGLGFLQEEEEMLLQLGNEDVMMIVGAKKAFDFGAGAAGLYDIPGGVFTPTGLVLDPVITELAKPASNKSALAGRIMRMRATQNGAPILLESLLEDLGIEKGAPNFMHHKSGLCMSAVNAALINAGEPPIEVLEMDRLEDHGLYKKQVAYYVHTMSQEAITDWRKARDEDDDRLIAGREERIVDLLLERAGEARTAGEAATAPNGLPVGCFARFRDITTSFDRNADAAKKKALGQRQGPGSVTAPPLEVGGSMQLGAPLEQFSVVCMPRTGKRGPNTGMYLTADLPAALAALPQHLQQRDEWQAGEAARLEQQRQARDALHPPSAPKRNSAPIPGIKRTTPRDEKHAARLAYLDEYWQNRIEAAGARNQSDVRRMREETAAEESRKAAAAQKQERQAAASARNARAQARSTAAAPAAAAAAAAPATQRKRRGSDKHQQQGAQDSSDGQQQGDGSEVAPPARKRQYKHHKAI